MRWRSKPLPETGDRRIVRKFAWLPTRMADGGVTAWFNHYWLCQRWLTWQSGHEGAWYDKGNIEDTRMAKMWRDKQIRHLQLLSYSEHVKNEPSRN